MTVMWHVSYCVCAGLMLRLESDSDNLNKKVLPRQRVLSYVFAQMFHASMGVGYVLCWLAVCEHNTAQASP